MTRRLASALALTILCVLVGGRPAAAEDDLLSPGVTRVAGLEALRPLESGDLAALRGGRLPTLPPRISPGAPPLRFWDEIGRPPRQAPSPAQGSVTTTSRGMR